MKIDISNGQFYYDLFYQMTFFIMLIIYLIEGYKRKFTWSTWLLLIVTTNMFLIIGSKFGAITHDDFNYFIENLQFPAVYNTNLIGALVFGFIGIGFAKVLLRIKYPILDAFALAIPFGLAVQSIGCLMVGCCYGTETNLPWGIQYGIHSPAFMGQFLTHHIGLQNALSLSIHPVQLYLVIINILIGLTLIRFRHYWKRAGNLTLFSLLLLFASRFIIEFFKDTPVNGSFQGNDILGLKVIQLISLVSILALVVIIRIREKNYVPKSYLIEPNHPLLNSSYLLFLSIVLYVTRSWFSTVEFGVLLIVLIPTIFLVLVNLVTSFYTAKVRLTTIVFILLSFVLMSQKQADKDSSSYKTFSLGYSSGDFRNTHSIGYGTGCDRQSMYQDFEQKYYLAGVGYSSVKKNGFNVFEYGMNGFFGTHQETGLTTGEWNNNQIFGINPFIKMGNKWFGGGVGFHLGNLMLTPYNWYEEGSPEMPQTATRNTNIYPQLYARIGPEKYAYISYHLGDQFPAPFPIFNHYVTLGSGLGFNNGFKVDLGVNFEGAFLLKAQIPFKDKFIIEPLYQWHIGQFPDYSGEEQFAVGLHYMYKTK